MGGTCRMSENIRHIKEKLHGIDALKHELALRFGLLGQVRKPEGERLELMVSLARINRELEEYYHRVRQCPDRSEEEEICLEAIRTLEDERFQLLNLMNGSQVKNYGIMPLSPGS